MAGFETVHTPFLVTSFVLSTDAELEHISVCNDTLRPGKSVHHEQRSSAMEWHGMEREKENTALSDEKGSDGGRPGTFPLKELPK